MGILTFERSRRSAKEVSDMLAAYGNGFNAGPGTAPPLSSPGDMIVYVIENFPDLRFTIPNATYLAWLDFSEYVKSGKIQGSPFDFFLNEAKVAFTDGKPFGEGCENVVRLNFACPRSMLEEGLERMRKAVYRTSL